MVIKVSMLTNPIPLKLVVGVPDGKNGYKDEETFFAQYTSGDIRNSKIILIGHRESDEGHNKMISLFLRGMVGPEDLILSEYVNVDETIIQKCRKVKNHDVFFTPLLGILLTDLIKTGVTIKGWDKTSLKDQVIQILSNFESMNERDVDILFRQRNLCMVEAIHNDYKKYRNIFVIAGAAHFCMSYDFSEELKAELSEVKKVQEQTFKLLRQYNPIILVPIPKISSRRFTIRKSCSISAIAMIMVGLIFVKIMS